MSQRANPQLSVVVASAWSVHDLERLLDSLIGQRPAQEFEVIVADCRGDDALERIIDKYPGVTFIRHSEKTPLPVLWGAGIARARGEIIAVTDATCRVSPDWIAATLKAHEAPHALIGGVVEAGRCQSRLDWAAYFCEYGQFMRPLQKGVAGELPGNNLSFKRWALSHGTEFVRAGFWKTYWCHSLQQAGVELVADPAVAVCVSKTYRPLPFLVRRFHHGRCFAGMRVAKASHFVRAGYAAGSWLLPFLFIARVLKMILSKRRFLGQFALALPWTILAILSWSLGECCGYLRGAGRSCDQIY
jgi:glycosyltransferase involved in cell wall biosynthesis